MVARLVGKKIFKDARAVAPGDDEFLERQDFRIVNRWAVVSRVGRRIVCVVKIPGDFPGRATIGRNGMDLFVSPPTAASQKENPN